MARPADELPAGPPGVGSIFDPELAAIAMIEAALAGDHVASVVLLALNDRDAMAAAMAGIAADALLMVAEPAAVHRALAYIRWKVAVTDAGTSGE